MEMDQVLSTLKQDHNIVLGYELDIATDFKILMDKSQYSTVIFVTDQNVATIYLEKLKTDFTKALGPSSRILSFIIPPGEGSKSRETKAKIEDFLLEHQCDRESCLIGLGGGVVGNLIGFVASTYLRGIHFVHIPTSLLAMADSSISDKNGIDTSHGKNLIGTFYLPKRNYIDLSFLISLPPREFYNGMAEIIKNAIVSDKDEFEILENGELLQPGEIHSENLLRVVTGAIRSMLNIMGRDGRDFGIQQILNFGHTIGHGIETLLAPSLLHGECVSIGMILETKIAIRLGHCSSATLDRLQAVLVKYNLPVSLAQVLSQLEDTVIISLEEIMKIIGVDKKNSGCAIRLVLLTEVGKTLEPKATAVPTAEVERVLMEELNFFTASNQRLNGLRVEKYKNTDSTNS